MVWIYVHPRLSTLEQLPSRRSNRIIGEAVIAPQMLARRRGEVIAMVSNTPVYFDSSQPKDSTINSTFETQIT